MGTKSLIAIENHDGTGEAIYCHWDGDLRHNGRTLHDHYANRDRVRELLALGNLSGLYPRLHPVGEHSFAKPEEGTTIAYHRDRGDAWKIVQPLKFDNLNDFCRENHDAAYVYVFTRDDRWMFYRNQSDQSAENLRDLAKALEEIETETRGAKPLTRFTILPQIEGEYRCYQQSTDNLLVHTATVMTDGSGNWWVSLFAHSDEPESIEYEQYIREQKEQSSGLFPRDVEWERIESQPLLSGWLAKLPRQRGYYWAYQKNTGRYLLGEVRWTISGHFNIQFTDCSAVMRPDDPWFDNYAWLPIEQPTSTPVLENNQ